MSTNPCSGSQLTRNSSDPIVVVATESPSLPPAVRIVTGAASGIGRAVARQLAAEGSTVVLADLDVPGVEAAAADIGGSARAVPADVTSSEDCAAVVRAAAEAGPLDALVNVAGIMAGGDSVETLPDEELERILAVNVGSIFRLGRHVIPELRRNGGGTIVNTASVHAFATMPRAAAYAASKGAVTALTRQMALDLAPDRIRVVAVAPGSVDTPLTRRELERRELTLEEAGFPTDDRSIGRVGAPEEVADVVSWLLSDGARLVNGTTVVADAGLLARLG